MCCLFGMLDYGHQLSAREKNRLLAVLSTQCEVRGTDATGIAYNSGGGLHIYKRPLPAHRMRFRIPGGVNAVMGHTRLTTQGSEKRNRNNHPFYGNAGGTAFALAHNGVLQNDVELRWRNGLPRTRIQTDSYIAVQLIEQKRALHLNSLKDMAEQVEGTFSFTVLDERDNLYFIKGGQSAVHLPVSPHGPAVVCVHRGYPGQSIEQPEADTGTAGAGGSGLRRDCKGRRCGRH